MYCSLKIILYATILFINLTISHNIKSFRSSIRLMMSSNRINDNYIITFKRDLLDLENNIITKSAYVRSIYKTYGTLGLLLLNNECQSLNTIISNNIYKESQLLFNTLSRTSKLTIGSVLDSSYVMLYPDISNSNAGRSRIYECVDRKDNKLLVIKIFNESIRYKNELTNYKIICENKKNPYFIDIQQIKETNNNNYFENNFKYSIIMEKGDMDLKNAISQTVSIRISAKNLKKMIRSMVQALFIIHRKGLVWTDLKLDNFIIIQNNNLNNQINQYFNINNNNNNNNIFQNDFIIKAIDLESIKNEGNTITDFSPEICTPEHCECFSQGQISIQGGRLNDLRVDLLEPLIASKAGDIWALGISILQLYTGKAPITDKSDLRAATRNVLSYINYCKDNDNNNIDNISMLINQVNDKLLQKLLISMLDINPKKRPSIENIKRSLYLLLP